MLLGNLTNPILIIISKQDIMGKAENIPLGGSERTLLDNALKRAGIPLDSVSYCLAREDRELIKLSEARVLVPVGELALNMLCGLKNQHKWWGSIIPSTMEFGGRKCIPMLDPSHTEKVYHENAYNALAAQKILRESSFHGISPDPRVYHIKPSFKEALQFLDHAKQCPELGIDIENFSTGIINTFGVAISPTEAMALRLDPGFWTPIEEFQLWLKIKEIIDNKKLPKAYQNFIYETLYFSRYGIKTNGVSWDTMWAMRFLYPEFEKGLDNVGRFFTPFPYWKDDKDDWSAVKDWDTHLNYNCKDTMATLWAKREQEKELKERGLYDLFSNYTLKLLEPVIEMCSRGLPVDEDRLRFLTKEIQTKIDIDMNTIDRITQERLGRTINIRSPKQLKGALKEMGIILPTKTNKETGESTETADKKALVKLKKRYPDEGIIDSLIRISKENKAMSSYLQFTYDIHKKIAPYTFDGCSTETLRMASYTDNWGRGFNAQTIPKWAKTAFKAPEGRIFVEIDLSQAESRYVAWDSPDAKLMDLINNKDDIHKYVASAIYQKPMDLITTPERQLGKKSGHAANYGVGPRTFAEACLVEMGLVISELEAKRIINAYFSVFPGIKRRQERIQRELRSNRKLTTPFGYERYFYGRCDDSMFREGYAFAPQSTIPYITNCLLLFLRECFEDLWLHAQIHDAILISIFPEELDAVMRAATDYAAWHPKLTLAGGDLIIPIEAEWGESWKPMQKLVL